MKLAPVFEDSFSKLYGKPCWGVTQGYASFLTFEFGEPHLVIREPVVASPGASKRVRESLARRAVKTRGDWHLWIYCCTWEISRHERRVAHNDSSDRMIRRAADFLNGQKLVRFSIAPRGVRCTFEFDLGGVLRTRPFRGTHDQWLLYEPTDNVLILRADSCYSHQPSNKPEADKNWKPIRS